MLIRILIFYLLVFKYYYMDKFLYFNIFNKATCMRVEVNKSWCIISYARRKNYFKLIDCVKFS